MSRSNLPQLVIASTAIGLLIVGWSYYDMVTIGDQFPWIVCYCFAVFPTLALALFSFLFWLRHFGVKRVYSPFLVNILAIVAFISLNRPQDKLGYYFATHRADYETAANLILDGTLRTDVDILGCGAVKLPAEYSHLARSDWARKCTLSNGTMLIFFKYDGDNLDGIEWGYLYSSGEISEIDRRRCSVLQELQPKENNWNYCLTDIRFQDPTAFSNQ